MDQKFLGLALIIIIGDAIADDAKLIQRGEAKPGVVLIILLLPILFIFRIQVQERGIQNNSGDISDELIIGVIASLIAGVILIGMKKKQK